ncbi:unnamed protein product, partial [Durusdinium trenchii]
MKSLKAVQDALQAQPKLSPIASSPSPSPRSRSRSRQRAGPVPVPAAPGKDQAQWCDRMGAVKLRVSTKTWDALGALLRCLRSLRQAPRTAVAGTSGTAQRSGSCPLPPAVPPRPARAMAQRMELPTARQRTAFLEVVAQNPVVIVQGATGSGKTTQLPQYILEHAAEQNERCRILVTQPRRVSCVSVARRVSEERGEALGHTVGYAIRHEHRGGDASCLTYCTQGVLLRRLESDPELQGITHIFADEVHERSLEGDLLLLLLRELSRRRSSHHSLHIIAMSATFDAHRLQKYFTNGSIQPVVFKLPGKMFPVKTIFLEDALEITKHQPDGPLIPNRRLCLSRYRASTKYSGAPCSQAPKVEDLSNYSVQQRYGHLSTSTRSALAAMDPNHVNF